MKQPINTHVAVAYSHCPRKAFLLMSNAKAGKVHEYVEILAQKERAAQAAYLEKLSQNGKDIRPYAIHGLKSKSALLTNATLQTETMIAECGLLTKVSTHSVLGHYSYEPTLFVGTHSISKEQKLALFFTAHALAQVQGKPPAKGHIVNAEGKSSKVKLDESTQTLLPVLEPLQEWLDAWVEGDTPEEPQVMLNKHCPLCQFRDACQAKANQEDNLSLLDRMTPKTMRKLERKGIFTVTQLSYTFKPRKRKKRAKNPPPVTHKLELQALAIREKKIYIQELPEIERKPVELFLDIEGIPDQNAYYLFGLLVCEGETSTHHSFWADTLADEAQIWQHFVEKASEYPDAPIYHYGNYEVKALKKLANRYETEAEAIIKRLVNVNGFIYGKVYFPTYSNRLKDLGHFIGTEWSSPEASGLQSLVWREHWEEGQDTRIQQLLMMYNREDCQALKMLTGELAKINNSSNTLSEVDFADQYKEQTSDLGQQVHSQFKEILNFAHFGYDSKKICFRQKTDQINPEAGPKKETKKTKKFVPKQSEIRQKKRKIVQIASDDTCPQCRNNSYKVTTIKVRRVILDLVLTKSGIKKTLTEYSGFKSYCSKCDKHYAPAYMQKYTSHQIYGHGFRAWMVHQRVALRLPYESIVESAFEYFNEEISVTMPMYSLQTFAKKYTDTYSAIVKDLLNSPSIHVDETKVNIRGANWYVWVFTNDKQVIFKLRETREAEVVHEFLANYNGILISDFYPGYDSVNCRQQKCWVHLIRDLNEDLLVNPFDKELEQFILQVRDLIIPIMETIQKYGLKKRNLSRFHPQVVKFYQNVIEGKTYKSDLTIKYQNRFIRYNDSLFSFLEHDGILWHNNTAERAIRPFAIQREISKVPLQDSVTKDYLILLSIRQTCRFQGKSFFKFLFSGKTDLDEFQKSKRSRKAPR
ncbi:MAG: IS66 family transposase [Chloroflexota bacterium]